MRLAALALLLASGTLAGCHLADPPGTREGRQGNARLAAEDAPAAAERYRAGLDAAGDAGALRAALDHNLGLALLAEERPADARAAFERSLGAAATADARARAAFHAGLAAADAGERAAARRLYRRALLERPDFPEARHNYALLARDTASDERGDPDAPAPSPFARDLKARADDLVAARRYGDALGLLEDGAQRDSTVLAYRDFMTRLGTVVEIEGNEPPPPPR